MRFFFIAIVMFGVASVNAQHQNSVVNFDKQGHRGCRGLYPENTIPAMKYALGLGVTTLEMDVVISKDNKVVLSHDPYFNSSITLDSAGKPISKEAEKSLRLYQMNYEEIRKYDVGMKFNPKFPEQKKIPAYKPLLSELFDSIRVDMMTRKRPFPFFNIETKCTPAGDDLLHPGPEVFVDLLMHEVMYADVIEYVTIQSFDSRTLQYLHKRFPSVQTALLIEQTDKRTLKKQIKKLGFVPTIYSPAYQLVSSRLIEMCHKKGMKIIPWTVNTKSQIEELKQLGVDGIISDYPNLFD
jgi:glycerophosphoryl diester phosphodiesterase